MTLIPKSIIVMHGIGVMEYKNFMTLIVKIAVMVDLITQKQ